MSTPEVNSANSKTIVRRQMPIENKSIAEMHDEKQISIQKSQDQKEREIQLKSYELQLYKKDIELREKELKFRMLQWDREQKKVG